MSGDIVTGGNGMAGAGWHLAVTGGGGGGLQTSGMGGDGTVGAGVVKGSDGGLQTSDDGGQQVGGSFLEIVSCEGGEWKIQSKNQVKEWKIQS